MILKQGFLVFFLLYAFNSFSLSGWDKDNRPELMKGNYTKKFRQLPLSGEISKRLWSGDYWRVTTGESLIGGIRK